MMETNILKAPFGFKADGTPRKRRPGAGRRLLRDPITERVYTNEEKKERWRLARAKWWRENKEKAVLYRISRKNRNKEKSLSILFPPINDEIYKKVFSPVLCAYYGDIKCPPFLLPEISPAEFIEMRRTVDHIKHNRLMMLIHITRTKLNEIRPSVLAYKRANLTMPPVNYFWPNSFPRITVYKELINALSFLRAECRRRGVPFDKMINKRDAKRLLVKKRAAIALH